VCVWLRRHSPAYFQKLHDRNFDDALAALASNRKISQRKPQPQLPEVERQDSTIDRANWNTISPRNADC
jgi:hypothetical protein